jgi:hypothetical protein
MDKMMMIDWLIKFYTRLNSTRTVYVWYDKKFTDMKAFQEHIKDYFEKATYDEVLEDYKSYSC